ncbi:MAG: ankyrin repeat domain-containing protein [Candidatus Babeliales bacterium]
MNVYRIVIGFIAFVIALSIVRYAWPARQDDVARRVIKAIDGLASQSKMRTEDEVFNITKIAIENEGLDPDYVDRGTGLSLLMYAARTGSYKLTRYLVDRGASPHYVNPLLETPLMYAALSGDMRVIKYFVEELDADVNAMSKGWPVLKWGKDFDQSKRVADYLRSKGAVAGSYEWGPQKRQPTHYR